MKTINEVLNYSFEPSVFVLAGKKIISHDSILHQDLQIKKLKIITESVGKASFVFNGDNLIPQVFRRFKFLYKNNSIVSDSFERRELKTLTYSLVYTESNETSILSSNLEFGTLLQAIDLNWRDTYLTGLIDCYLKNWDSTSKDSLNMLGEYIQKKLKVYSGSRLVFKCFKSNLRYYDRKAGDIILGSDLSIKNISILNLTKYLSLPESFKTYSYFSKVICTYYEKRKNTIVEWIDDLSESLIGHNNLNTSKMVISKLIIQSTKEEFMILQDKIKTLAFALIGDPGNGGNWMTFENANDTEKVELKDSRRILNEWITRQFFNVFFEKCINNPRRKVFWLKYTNEIIQFRVVGSSVVKQMLLDDERISSYVNSRFSNTRSLNEKNSALMFIMRNHLFVEFSDDGAFYVYKTTNHNAPSIDSIDFQTTESLKTPSMKQLVYRNRFNFSISGSEGKLSHRDGDAKWEKVASHWLQNEAHIYV